MKAAACGTQARLILVGGSAAEPAVAHSSRPPCVTMSSGCRVSTVPGGRCAPVRGPRSACSCSKRCSVCAPRAWVPRSAGPAPAPIRRTRSRRIAAGAHGTRPTRRHWRPCAPPRRSGATSPPSASSRRPTTPRRSGSPPPPTRCWLKPTSGGSGASSTTDRAMPGALRRSPGWRRAIPVFACTAHRSAAVCRRHRISRWRGPAESSWRCWITTTCWRRMRWPASWRC